MRAACKYTHSRCSTHRRGKGSVVKKKKRQSSMRMRRSAERTINNGEYRLKKVIKRVSGG